MTTDLERFVDAPGRDEKIRQVRELINAKGIEYLYLQFVSVTGKIMGKGIPADHWETVAKKGFQLVYGATVNLFTGSRRQLSWIRFRKRAELVGIPEPETFMQLPWAPTIGRLYCTLFGIGRKGNPVLSYLRLPRKPATAA